MQIVADLHIHSHYSRATSKDLTFEQLARWAQLKGVHIVGTGDIAHPGWLQEMRAKLEPAEDGLFRLKAEVATAVEAQVPPACRGSVRFLLAGEISNIYKRHGAVRKVHNVISAPSLAAVEQIQLALEKIGNIRADGRPILGLDSRDLLEIILDIDARCHLIPAHIWTPWFSMLGSKSGFDSVEECFGDLTSHIFALETGLSSDPPMNWRVSNLDRYTLVSNSDAHSPQKLAREATLFQTELAYDALFGALQTGDPATFAGTIEFFPEEGKYHLDGHRKCGICWEPPATLAHQGICPVCGRELTIGVMHRVGVLADRAAGYRPLRPHPYHHLIPLPEVVGEVQGTGAGAKRVLAEYARLLERLGPELYILLHAPLEDIATIGGSRLAEGIRRMRSGQVTTDAGYDGEYGVIKLFAGAMAAAGTPQIDLFAEQAAQPATGQVRKLDVPTAHPISPKPVLAVDTPVAASADWSQTPLFTAPTSEVSGVPGMPSLATEAPWLAQLNADQRAAVLHTGGPLVIVAGPGTGKTHTLTVRLAHLLQTGQAAPEAILAVTFTNKAAAEMAERLSHLVGLPVVNRLTVKTFHAFGAMLLRSAGARIGLPANFAIASEEDRRTLVRPLFPDLHEAEIDRRLALVADAKNRLLAPDAVGLAAGSAEVHDLPLFYQRYEAALRDASMLDFDDLILQAVRLCEADSAVLKAQQARFGWIAVDEYQDLNLGQYHLLRLLAAGGANLCVIGDPDQAIYGFRGADPSYFHRFHEDYPGAKSVRLGRSYRSPQAYLDAASQVMARQPDRAAVKLWSDFTQQIKLDLYGAPTDKAEAEYVVHQIEQMVGGTSHFSLDSGRVDGIGSAQRSFADFAVLYRLGAQNRLLAEAFERSGIPYQVVGQASFYAAKAVRRLLDCLWLLYNPLTRIHLEGLLSTGDARPAPQLVAEVERLAQGGDLAAAFTAGSTHASFTAAQRRRLAALAAFWRDLEASRASATIVQLVERCHAFLNGPPEEPASRERTEWLAQLCSRAAPYGSRLDAFLDATALQREADGYDRRADRVTLMTLHTAKGLEFPVVFIAGCEEGLLPYLPEHRRSDLEEERRLFYVGLTRAQQKLILTHARSRFLFGEARRPAVSRFVDDIAQTLLAIRQLDARPIGKDAAGDLQLGLF